MKVNVFPIFPDSFLNLHDSRDSAAAFTDFAQDVVDGVAGAGLPRRTPDNPTCMIDAKDIFRKAEFAGPLINRILAEDAHCLGQSSIEVGWFHSVIHNQHIARLCVFAQELAAFGDGARIFAPQIANVDR